MTLTIMPGPTTTSSGNPLPCVAVPQGELLTVNENNIPLLRDSLAPGVHVKPLRLDLGAGCWVVLATFSPGAQVPLHYHTGIAEVYTLSGRWHYAEYSDQPQTAGSYLFEPAGSVHTFITPESNTEDTCCLSALRAPTSTSPRTDSSTRSSTRRRGLIGPRVNTPAPALGAGRTIGQRVGQFIGGGYVRESSSCDSRTGKVDEAWPNKCPT